MCDTLNYFLYMNAIKDLSINRFENENPPIFHYTKMETFSKIVANQSFRFTDYRYLNDTQEFVWGIKQLKNTLENLKGKTAKLILENLGTLNKVELYVASFSLEPDLLSQWRAYGDNGKGVSSGVNPIAMLKVFGASFFHGKVIYDSKKQTIRIKRVVNASFEYFEKKVMTSKDIESIVRYLSLTIATFKHQSFIEEREYRLFVFSNTPQRPYWLEEGLNSETKPFYCIKTADLPIQEFLPIEKIFIGPSNDFYSSEIFVRKLFEANKYEFNSSNIVKSKIPYRIV